MKVFNKVKWFWDFKADAGSTIIELLISLMVVGLVVTAVAVAGTYSIKNTGEARFKQAATILAQEVIEKSRAEKNRLGFINFGSAVGTDIYCFDNIPEFFDSLSSGACDADETKNIAGASFTREVIFTGNPVVYPTTIEVKVTVSWNDAEKTRSVELIQEFLKPNQGY